jgi:hypothetical protein
MSRTTGTYAITATLGESVRAFVPEPLPPADPPLAPASFVDLDRHAELALARLAGVSGLVPSVDRGGPIRLNTNRATISGDLRG